MPATIPSLTSLPAPAPSPSQQPAPGPGPGPAPAPSPQSSLLQSPPPESLPSSEPPSTPSIDIENGKRIDSPLGFIYVSVKGSAADRGYAQGFLLAERIVKFIRTYAFFLWTEYGRDVIFFKKMIKDLFGDIVFKQYNEFYLEMEGIARGVVAKISSLKTDEEKDNYFTKGAIDGKRIFLPQNSYLAYDNLVYNNASSEEKQKYTSSGKMPVDIDVDIIFLLNCIVTIDYVYSKLPQIFNGNKSLESSSVYKEYYGISTTPSSSSSPQAGIFGFLSSKGGSGESSDRCSGFMAIGPDYTAGGGIVCAHITFDNFMTGQFDNIILYMDTSMSNTPQTPSYNILMQTFPGGVFSSTDFFVTSAKIMGMETTIGGFNVFELRAPACVRHRKAMQYGGSHDDYIKYLSENNSGDYANTWYIGHATSKDPETKKERPEIMRIELGLKYMFVEKKTNGYFIGFNACYDARIRNLECVNDGFFDIRRHSGARRVTLDMKIKEFTDKEKRISVNEAQQIISSHWDVYLEKDNPCSRTICSHYELDKREYMSQESRPKPNQPKGSVDAKICTSELCNKMQFIARWGNACGTDFKKDAFCNLHKQWEYQRDYLEDRLEKPWVVCSEVNITKKDHIMSSAIIKYQGGISTPVTPTMPTMPTMPTTQTMRNTPSSNAITPIVKNVPLPAPLPATTTPMITGGTQKQEHGFDNKKELKEFNKMFKKQNKKSYKAVSNTRRNKRINNN